MLRVIVGERQRGRTTALCRWLMQGKAIDHAPGWSRVIVIYDQAAKAHTIRRLREVATEWSNREEGRTVFNRAHELVMVCNGVDEMPVLMGMPDVQYGVDDLELLLWRLLAQRLGSPRLPEAVTITGHSVALGSSMHGGTDD